MVRIGVRFTDGWCVTFKRVVEMKFWIVWWWLAGWRGVADGFSWGVMITMSREDLQFKWGCLVLDASMSGLKLGSGEEIDKETCRFCVERAPMEHQRCVYMCRKRNCR